MSVLPDTIETSRHELRKKIQDLWHADLNKTPRPAIVNRLGIVMAWDEAPRPVYDSTSSPIIRLVTAFGDAPNSITREPLSWLAFFVARRVLPCWELYCDTPEPREAVGALAQWLTNGVLPDSWEVLSHAPFPSYQGEDIVDCRACDTGAAAEAVANAVQYMMKGEPSYAVKAIQMADDAFDQSPLVDADSFRKWLIETAIPVAWENREMTADEQARYRTYDPDSIRVS